MKFYDYEVEDVRSSFNGLTPVDLARSISSVLDVRSKKGWRLFSMTADGQILVFERDSVHVEAKRVSTLDLRGDQDDISEQLAAEGWFVHSADAAGITFTRKKS